MELPPNVKRLYDGRLIARGQAKPEGEPPYSAEACGRGIGAKLAELAAQCPEGWYVLRAKARRERFEKGNRYWVEVIFEEKPEPRQRD